MQSRLNPCTKFRRSYIKNSDFIDVMRTLSPNFETRPTVQVFISKHNNTKTIWIFGQMRLNKNRDLIFKPILAYNISFEQIGIQVI